MNWRTDLHSGPAVSTDKVSLLTLEHLRLSSEPLETNLQITELIKTYKYQQTDRTLWNSVRNVVSVSSAHQTEEAQVSLPAN